MAISVVQSAAAVKWALNTSRNATLNGVAAGNSLIVLNAAANTGGTTDPSFAWDDGTSYTLASHKDADIAHRTVQVAYRHNVGANNYTVTGSHGVAGAVRGQFIFIEVSGLANAGPETMGTGGAEPFDGSDVAVSSSADTVVSGSYLHLAVCIAGIDPQDAGNLLTAPAGFTTLLLDTADINTDGAVYLGYRVNSSAQSPSYGTVGDMYYWAVATIPFAEAVSSVKRMLLLGAG